MIIKQGQIEAALTQPDPAWRVMLIYGSDRGLVHERCCRLLNTFLGAGNRDPFLYSELDATVIATNPARLVDEGEALSPLGRRIVLIRAHQDNRNTDCLASPLKTWLTMIAQREQPHPRDTILIIEGGDVAKRSKLRVLCEPSPHVATLPCYPDEGQNLRAVIRQGFAALNVTPSSEALAYLESIQGGDRLATRSEIEKLALYAGIGGVVDLEMARRVSGSNNIIGLTQLCHALVSNKPQTMEAILARLHDDGVPEILQLRAVMRYFTRLHKAACRLKTGKTPEEAIADFRPPLFFKEKPVFFAALRAWSPHRISRAMERLLEAEKQCKQNHTLAAVLSDRAFLAIATPPHPVHRARS